MKVLAFIKKNHIPIEHKGVDGVRRHLWYGGEITRQWFIIPVEDYGKPSLARRVTKYDSEDGAVAALKGGIVNMAEPV